MKSLPSVFPAASTCALQCFSLRTKAPLPASRVSVVVQRPWLIEEVHFQKHGMQLLGVSAVLKESPFLKHSDEIVPTMIHSALWRGFSRSFRLRVAKQAQVIWLRQQSLQWHQWRCPGVLVSIQDLASLLQHGNPVSLKTGIQDSFSSQLCPIIRKQELGTSRSQSSVTVKLGTGPLPNPFGK